MHRLLWKLFFTYWLALLVFSAGTLFFMNQYLEQVRTRHQAATPREDLRAHLQAAQDAAAAGGLKGLAAWARSVDDQELVPWLVLDDAGRDVLGREVSPGVLARLDRSRHPERHEEPQRPDRPEGVEREQQAERPAPPPRREPITADGRPYWLLPDFQNASLTRVLSRPRVLAVPVALAAVVGGVVSLLLARYLAAPIERLRRATLAYATGDFSQRVGPTLGRRSDEIVDLAYALDEMAERLDTLLAAQRDLLRDVSHELRSPLARVQAALGLAAQRGSGVEEELARIERETERLNELIGAILSFSQLESGVQPPLREGFDLAELLAVILDDAGVEGAARQIEIRSGGETAAPFQGDPGLIHSALENILRNALRHSPEGGVVAVSLRSEPHADGRAEYVVRIRDSGPGVPEAMLEKIFDPFVRLDTARPKGGAGLGLAIARRAVLAHGGRLRAENAEGGGLLVTVRLPAGG